MLCIVTFYLPWVLLIYDSVSCFLCVLPEIMLLQNVNVKKNMERGEKVKIRILVRRLFQLPVYEVTKKTLSNVLAERMKSKD